MSFRTFDSEPSYTNEHHTVATNPSARAKLAIRTKMKVSISGVNVSISAEELLGMTDAHIREALGVPPCYVPDSDHASTTEVLDAAALCRK